MIKKKTIGREKFEEIIKQKLSPKDVGLVMLAYRLSKYGHRNQERDDGGRYFEHPKRVALILMNELKSFSKNVIIEALLHDIEEDSFILKNRDINLIFGKSVAGAIAILTKNKKREASFYFKKIKKANKEVRIVKLADRLDNVRDMEVWNKERKQKYILETRKLILPWAYKTNKYLAEKIEQNLLK